MQKRTKNVRVIVITGAGRKSLLRRVRPQNGEGYKCNKSGGDLKTRAEIDFGN